MSEELLLAIRRDEDPEDIVYLLDVEGVDIDYQDREGYTALMEATLIRNIPILKLLLERNASIDLVDINGMSALNHVYGEEDIEEHCLLPIINLLLDYDADYQHVDNEGDSLLKCAAVNGHITVVARLLQFTDINLADAMNFAIEGGNQAMIDFLESASSPDEQTHAESEDGLDSVNSFR